MRTSFICLLFAFLLPFAAHSQICEGMEFPIYAGSYDDDFSYSDTQNTADFSDTYGRYPSEIFYQIFIDRPMRITVTHCGSEVEDTYLYLFEGNYNDTLMTVANNSLGSTPYCQNPNPLQAGLQIDLTEPGYYYITSEGYSEDGVICTNITGECIEFDYPTLPPLPISSSNAPVGALGGNLSVSPLGAAVYSIPIETPPGVNGLTPSVAITYNSQSGNGIAGWGCNLSGFSVITRGPKTVYYDGTAKGITYGPTDAFYLDGQRLILVNGTAGVNGAEYQLESDRYTRVIFKWEQGVQFFEVRSPNGLKTRYTNSAIGIASYETIYSWYIDRVEDLFGNYMTYNYDAGDNGIYRYPTTITYGDNQNTSTGLQNSINFTYSTRQDQQPIILYGVKENINKRLSSIIVKTGTTVLRTYNLQYDTTSDGTASKFSRLTGVTMSSQNKTLEPIQLTWSYLPSFTQTHTVRQMELPDYNNAYSPSTDEEITLNDQEYIAFDSNGDGITDIIALSSIKYYGNETPYTKASTYRSHNLSAGVTQYSPVSSHQFVGDYTSLKDFYWYDIGSFSGDIDGNGELELIYPIYNYTNGYEPTHVDFWYYGSTQASPTYIIQDDLEIPLFGTAGFNNGESKIPLFGTSDFDNDGKDELIVIEKGGLFTSNNTYQGAIAIYNGETAPITHSLSFTLAAKPERLFISDFNGDGLQDLLIFYDGGYSIFKNLGGGWDTPIFSSTPTVAPTYLGNVFKITPGDFNGDGYMDFLMNETNDTNWYIALNNGNYLFTKTLACTLNVYNQDFTGKDDYHFNCLVYDFDVDGKSDVVITKATYTRQMDFVDIWGEFSKTYTYWMRSNGSTLTMVKSATSNREDDALNSRNLLGDFDGDGQIELMNYGYDCYNGVNADADPVWRLYKNPLYNQAKGKITYITGDYGATTNLFYSPLASNRSVYEKTPDNSENTYPVAKYTPPLHVVSRVYANNGAASNSTHTQFINTNTTYRYRDLMVHKQGKGILGFSAVKATNTILGTITETGVSAWDNTFHIPSATYQRDTVGTATAQTITSIAIISRGNKKYQ
ncbi:MAG: FG-GAP-like repeat-containing protein, partial [Prevotellaceae bacterium]|nr:FG-GAP-like repeat-containing protein [Prevotellaceae bacterium]